MAQVSGQSCGHPPKNVLRRGCSFMDRTLPLGLPLRSRKLTWISLRSESRLVDWVFRSADRAIGDGARRIGADGGTRTLTGFPPQDFKSCVSTSSTTSASGQVMAGERVEFP